jgi:hypothetical protein
MRRVLKRKCHNCQSTFLPESRDEDNSLCPQCRWEQTEKQRIYDTDTGLGQCHLCGSRNLTSEENEIASNAGGLARTVGGILLGTGLLRVYVPIIITGAVICVISFFLPDYVTIGKIYQCQTCGRRREA